VTDLTANGTTRRLPAHGVSFGEALRVWLRIAAMSFGGPAGQISVMHRIIEGPDGIGQASFDRRAIGIKPPPVRDSRGWNRPEPESGSPR